METIFPTAPGYQGAFLVSFRKNPLSLNQRVTQRVGTVLLKRSYTINATTGALSPQGSPVPIFMNDQMDGSTLRYESDMVAFKPEADVVVLGFAGTNGVHEAFVGNEAYLRRTISGPGERDLFGWEPRTNEDFPQRRQHQAGGHREQASDYPALWPVPADAPERDPLPGGPSDPRTPVFDNRFYNGYLRTAALGAAQPFDYPATTTEVEIQRNGSSVYDFTLAAETVTAAYYYYIGTGPDDECAWRRQMVQMNLDTLVVEPDANRCYAVWRGVWDFDQHLPDLYRRLRVEASS
jgi:hypothetical protein